MGNPCHQTSDKRYFNIIVKLFIYRKSPNFSDQRDEIFAEACNLFESKEYAVTEQTDLLCLLMDLLTCPFISLQKRTDLLLNVCNNNSKLENINCNQAKKIVQEIEQQPWFVQWQGIDLRKIVEKKELSPVYS